MYDILILASNAIGPYADFAYGYLEVDVVSRVSVSRQDREIQVVAMLPQAFTFRVHVRLPHVWEWRFTSVHLLAG